MNTFGNIYRLTSFGESHGPAVGGVIDGLPAGIRLSLKEVQTALARRRPGTGANVTTRNEPDRLHILSGVMALENPDDTDSLTALTPQSDIVVSLGTPIGFYVENTDARPDAYDTLRNTYRPNHADYTYDIKYGIRDWRGGGRSSGRETISRVVAGAFAQQILTSAGININAKVTEIGGCSDPTRFNTLLQQARAAGDSLGSIVTVEVTGVPAGLGEPTFCKLQQMLASAIFSIGAVHGFEYGDGFAMAAMRGSEAADCMQSADDADYENSCASYGPVKPRFSSNHCGGILGGISSGQPIRFRVAFKPTPSIGQPLPTVGTRGTNTTVSTASGRHDPCIGIRGCEVVRAMTAMVIYDALLLSRTSSH